MRKLQQAHVEDCSGLPVGQDEFCDHRRFRLVLGTDDLDDPVEVEESDDVTCDELEPVVDFRDAMPRTADEDDDLMLQPFGEQLFQPHHLRCARRVEHVEIERETAFEVGQAEQSVLEHLGVDVAALGFEDDAQIPGALVADILEDRELLVGDQLRDLFDQLALGDAVWNFADHELPVPPDNFSIPLSSPTGRRHHLPVEKRARTRKPPRPVS